MAQSHRLLATLILTGFFFFGFAVAQEALLQGTYGLHASILCLEPKMNEMGAYPDLPHFQEQEDGSFTLLVPAETVNYQAVGTALFDGEGGFVLPETSALIITNQRISPGDLAFQPLNPLSCTGEYTVNADRSVVAQAICQIPLPGGLPLVAQVGPAKYQGFLGANPGTLLLADVTPELGLTEIRLGDVVVATYELICTQNMTLVKIDSDQIQFAQFGNGGGLTSDFVLTNPTAVEATGSVRFMGNDGDSMTVGIVGQGLTDSVPFTLEPLGEVTISTDGMGSPEAGSARVEADQNIGAVVRFELPGIGVAGVARSETLTGFIAPVRREPDGINTGLAIVNLENEAITIDLVLRDEMGLQVATRTLENFPARGHTSLFLQELFPGYDSSNFKGSITATANGGRMAATAIEFDAAGRKFTTLSVTALN